MRHDPFAPPGCRCPHPADRLRSALAGEEPEACPVHAEPEDQPDHPISLRERVGQELGLTLNASAAEVARALGMNPALPTNNQPPDAA